MNATILQMNQALVSTQNNDLLARYVLVQEEEKHLAKLKEELRSRILELGNTSTEHYVAIIKEQTRRQLASTDVFVEKFGEEALRATGLLKDSTYKTVTVKARG